MAGDVQSLDEARRARHAGADAEGMSRRAAVANIYVTRAEEALVLLSDAGDDTTRAAFRRITESWLELATAELSSLPSHA
jgi:hypothetical protein